MADNTEMQDVMMSKVCANPNFMGWYLTCFMKNRGWQEIEMLAFLKTDKENYFRLAMCKVPQADSEEFPKDVNKIATFTKISVFTLANLIREVHSINSAKDNLNSTIALMAARQQPGKEDEPK